MAGDTGAGDNCERGAWKPTLIDTAGGCHGGSADRIAVDKLHVSKLRALSHLADRLNTIARIGTVAWFKMFDAAVAVALVGAMAGGL